MSTDWLSLMNDYGGLLIGLLLLWLAVSVLPQRIKWYVLTAGVAVLGYEAYMRTVNRKLLQEADAERERLRAELDQMEDKRKALETTVNQLSQRMAELNARTAELNEQKSALDQQGEDLSSHKQALDKETAQIMAENQQLIEQTTNSEALLAKLAQARYAIAQMDKITH